MKKNIFETILSSCKKSPRATIDRAQRVTSSMFLLAEDSPGVGAYSGINQTHTIGGKSHLSMYRTSGTTFAGHQRTRQSESPGPMSYTPKTVSKPKTYCATIGNEKKKPLFSSASKDLLPGPACYSPKPVLPKSKMVSIRLPAPTVYIMLTPGVGKYDVKPVLRKETSVPMSTARKVSMFEVEKNTPGPANYEQRSLL